MTRRVRNLILLCAALAALLVAAPGAGAVKKRQIGGEFDAPVSVAAAPGYRKLLFVVEQQGTVRVIKRNRQLRRPFLKIKGLVDYDGAERGLLSIAFPPNYKQSKRFYVFYTDNDGDLRIEEFRRRSPTKARRGSRRLVIEIPHRKYSNHNGGQLQFLGDLLYIGTGDGGGGGDPDDNAQNLESLLGKILRIDPRAGGGNPYSVPGSNPFVGRAGRDEIYSYGLRNPWRFSIDSFRPGGPYLAIGDAGQDRFEEIDYVTVGAASGANFGWDILEGFAPYPDSGPNPGGLTPPILAYGGGSNCAVIGGYVGGKGAPGALRGRYVYADFCGGQVRSFAPSNGNASGDRPTGVGVDSPSSFGTDNRGRLYVASLVGRVYRLVRG